MFSRIFIERPRLAAVVSLILLLAGGISLANLPVAEYPEIAPPTLFVSATYTGASADVVAQTVAMPLENEINGVEDLLYFSSTSSNSGSYSCSVTFRSGTDSDIALVNLQNAVKRAESQLPSEVTKVGITVEKRGNDTLAMLAFQTDGTSLSLNELVNYVNNNVKDALARLEGVSSSEMMSQQEYAMRIWMDPLRMSGLGISSSEIRSAVEAQNVQAAAARWEPKAATATFPTSSMYRGASRRRRNSARSSSVPMPTAAGSCACGTWPPWNWAPAAIRGVPPSTAGKVWACHCTGALMPMLWRP